MGLISFYFSLKVKKDYIKKILKLFQPVYIDKIWVKYHLDQTKLCNIPMKEKILLPNKRPEANQRKRKRYQRMTWFLMFSIIETKPDITFANSIVS